jgi:hypothetical protein
MTIVESEEPMQCTSDPNATTGIRAERIHNLVADNRRFAIPAADLSIVNLDEG